MSRTNSQFLGASVNEFIQIWALGGDATLNLTTSGGLTKVAFNCTLGEPSAPHSIPPSPAPCTPLHPNPHRPRHRGPAQREKNRQRAVRHQAARLEATAPVSSAVSAPATASMTTKSTSSTVAVDSTTVVSSTPSTNSELSKDTEVSERSGGDTSPDFKCDQCDYSNIGEKGLRQHKRMKHCISQLDGMNDEEESTEDSKIVTVDKINPFCPLGTDHHPSFSSQAEEYNFWKKRAATIEAEMKRMNYSVP